MAAYQTTSVSGTGYASPYVNSLLWGDGVGWSFVSSSAPITYYFGTGTVSADRSTLSDDPLVNDSFAGVAWTQAIKNAFVTALNNYAAVCNLHFAQASSAATADVVWWQLPGNDPRIDGLYGMHEVPDGTNPSIYGYFNSNPDYYWTPENVVKGGFGYLTIIHELGHGFGLAHPHDGGGDGELFPGIDIYGDASDLGTYDMNQGIWTTMTYNDGWAGHISGYSNYGWQGGLMALDIAALQQLYGANMTTATGNNTYTLPKTNATGTYWSCIWDAGGTDTISNQGSSIAATINLNAAPLTGANAGGYVSLNTGIYGGFTIANGVTIENAMGGNGNDVLVGNAANNTIYGMAGNDTMSGGLGNDVYSVQDSGDIVTEYAGQGIDTVISTVSFTLGSNVENVYLSGLLAINGLGNADNNVIKGNSAANILNGYAGNDTMIGGLGNDMYGVQESGDIVQENLNEGTDTVWAAISYALTANVENLYLGGPGNINGTGNALNNTITGNASDNILNGNTGADILKGAGGNDTYYIDNASDVVTENLAEGNDTVISGIQYTLGNNLENLFLSGVAGIKGLGNALDNIIIGNAGNNILNGYAGNDTINSGLGNDTVAGGLGQDIFRFSTALGSTNRDTIYGFVVADDTIQLKNTVFASLTATGVLSNDMFAVGTSAQDANDFIIYNNTAGTLSYDADGNGVGAAVTFATLVGTSGILTATDFVVF